MSELIFQNQFESHGCHDINNTLLKKKNKKLYFEDRISIINPGTMLIVKQAKCPSNVSPN